MQEESSIPKEKNKFSHQLVSILAFILVLTLFILIFYASIKAIKIIYHSDIKIEGGLDSSVLAIIVTALVSLLTIVISKHLESRAELKKKQQEKKIPVYEEFMTFWFKILTNVKNKTNMNDNETENFFFTWTSKLILWGSNDVIKTYEKFKNFGSQATQKPDPMEFNSLFGKVLIAMRKDLGYPTISEDDLLALYITDWQEHKRKKS